MNAFPLRFIHLLAATFLFATSLDAQLLATPPRTGAATGDYDLRADRVEYDSTGNLVTARGNVFLRRGTQSLRADTIVYNTVTESARATGNVVFTNNGQVWRGEQLTFNFITQTGDFPDLLLEFDVFRVKADHAERVSPIQSRMEGVTLTTCEDTDRPEFKIKAASMDVFEERVFSMRHPVFYLRGVPFFYLPRLTLDQERQATNIDVMPGFSTREGFFLLTAYNRYPSEGYRTKTHLDLRSKRGVAVGQDFHWYDPVENRDHTRIRAYYAHDQQPYRNEGQEERLRAQGIEVEESRYRMEFVHRNNFGSRDTLRVQAAYWSDPRILQDFFRREFREQPVPETRVTYSFSGNGWIGDLEASRQLNDDDFNAVNRLPEGSFTIPRRPVFEELPLLYESVTRAGYLERNFRELERDGGRENYETLRAHTEHRLFFPTRHFGWLNVIPRAGFAYTHYGETLDRETRVETISEVDEETGIITTTFNTNTVEIARGAEGRLLPELGLETSFSAFGVWHNEPTAIGRGLRHVVEPFANYTFIPEPDLTPDRIYQFDDIDRMGEAHNIRFGVRNKFQTRRERAGERHRIHDLVNATVATRYDLRDDAPRELGNIEVDVELVPVDWMRMRVDGEYNTETSELEVFNSEISFIHPRNRSSLSIDQRYRVDQNHIIQLRYDLNPLGRVGLEGYSRFDLEEDGFEEQELLLRVETECVGYGLGVAWVAGDKNLEGRDGEDEYRVWVQVWLTAFPRGIVNIGGR